MNLTAAKTESMAVELEPDHQPIPQHRQPSGAAAGGTLTNTARSCVQSEEEVEQLSSSSQLKAPNTSCTNNKVPKGHGKELSINKKRKKRKKKKGKHDNKN